MSGSDANELAHWVGVLRQAAAFVKVGRGDASTQLLEQVQTLPNPLLSDVCLAILNEMPTHHAAFRENRDGNLARCAEHAHDQFLAARVLRVAVVRDWATRWRATADHIAVYAENYVFQNAALLVQSPCVSLLGEMCTLWAIVWKLEWGGGRADAMAAYLQRLLSMLANSGVEGVVARAVATRAVEELAMLHPSSQGRGLTLAQHEACRREFLRECARPIFSALCSDLVEVAARNAVSGNETRVAHSLRCLHTILCCRMSAVSMAATCGGAASEGNVADSVPTVIDFDPEWQPLLCAAPTTVDPTGAPNDTLALLDRYYSGLTAMARGASTPTTALMSALTTTSSAAGGSGAANFQQFQHRHQQQTEALTESLRLILQCVVQLCGASGDRWNPEAVPVYGERCYTLLFAVTRGVMSSFGADSSAEQSLEVCCQGFYRLCTSLPLRKALFRVPSLPTTFLQPLLGLTEAVIQRAMVETADDDLMTECLDWLLKCWRQLVRDGLGDVGVRCEIGPESPLATALAELSARVFERFVQTKVAQDYNSAAYDDLDDTTHAEEYAMSHTQLVALLGREQPRVVCSMLNGMFVSAAQRYLGAVQTRRLPTRQENEALWYMTTVAGHLLADSSDSERSAVPPSFVALAVDIEREVVASTGNAPEATLAQQEAMNPSFALLSSVIRFATDLQPLLVQSSAFVSPGVCEALLFVLKGAADSYVCPDETLNVDLPAVFGSAFSGGSAIAAALLRFAASAMGAFSRDSSVVDAALAALTVLTLKSDALKAWVVTQEAFCFLANVASEHAGTVVRLGGKHRGALFGFLLGVHPIAGVGHAIVGPVITSVMTVVARAEEQVQPQRQTRELSSAGALIAAVQTVEGACTALRTAELIEIVFPSIREVVARAVGVAVANPRDRPLLCAVLAALEAIVTSVGSFLPAPQYYAVLESSLSLVSTVGQAMAAARDERAASVVSRATAAVQSQDEDELIGVLTAAAVLFHAIATWSLMDFSSDDAADSDVRARRVSDFCVAGLVTVLDFSDSTVLEIPATRDVVFRLLREVAQSHTEQFLEAATAGANGGSAALLRATEFALSSPVPDLVRTGFGVMDAIASFVTRRFLGGGAVSDAAAVPPALRALLEQMFASVWTTTATSAIDANVMPSLGNAVYSLVPAVGGSSRATELVFACWSSQARLEGCFTMLADVLGATDFNSRRRDARFQFAARLENVLMSVRSTQLW